MSRVLMVIAVLAMLAYPFFEAYHLTVDNHIAQIPDLPKALKNLKIAYVTDIHRSGRYPQSMVEDLIRTVNGLSADLVLFGGDYADNSAESINFFQTIPKVQARLGVYGIVGDADRTGNDPDDNLSQLVKAMTNAGVLPLVNSVAKVRVGQTNLYIAGVDDYYNGHPDVTSVAAQVNQSDFVIFLGHTPDLLPSAIKAVSADGDNHWFDLALFGHTHGGQITLFGMTLLPEYMPDVGTRYLSGWLEENRAEILISNGVGTGIFPARLFAPSQIHLITLRPKTV